MFSRVASTVTRAAPLRAAAARRAASSGAAAAAASQTSSSLRVAAAAIATVAGGVAFSKHQQQETSAALCAAASSFPYTGVPGTANERSFIVSVGGFNSGVLVSRSCLDDVLRGTFERTTSCLLVVCGYERRTFCENNPILKERCRTLT